LQDGEGLGEGFVLLVERIDEGRWYGIIHPYCRTARFIAEEGERVKAKGTDLGLGAAERGPVLRRSLVL
jgi:hypothetical protein